MGNSWYEENMGEQRPVVIFAHPQDGNPRAGAGAQ